MKQPMPQILRGDARQLPLPHNSVDLIVTSPPYFGLRSYTDGGEHYEGQIGSEPTPAEFIDALIECTREMVRVLKPSGSIFVNLGDKYNSAASNQQSGGELVAGRSAKHNEAQSSGKVAGHRGQTVSSIRQKSLLLLPERYRIACVDQLGLIARAVIVWAKPNGLPESVTDRVRRSHEDWVHLTKQPRYFAAVDEIREAHSPVSVARSKRRRDAPDLTQVGVGSPNTLDPSQICHPLGSLPGSVWPIATQPLKVPAALGVDHFAAFPMEWPRRLIQGWCPREVCTGCGEGRRPVVERGSYDPGILARRGNAAGDDRVSRGINTNPVNLSGPEKVRYRSPDVLTGYACACPDTSAPTTPGTVLDPFGGTGTTALVATMLGRTGISVDLSSDYNRLAEWRAGDPKERARAAGLDPDEVALIRPQLPGQGSLLDLLDGDAS